jgi:hypothetical protein
MNVNEFRHFVVKYDFSRPQLLASRAREHPPTPLLALFLPSYTSHHIYQTPITPTRIDLFRAKLATEQSWLFRQFL